LRKLAVFVALAFSCVGLQACANGKGKTPNPTVVEARGKIATLKEQALLAASRVKTSVKPESEEYAKARQLYDTAMAENNGWVTSLKLGIQGGENLKNSAEFKNKADAAAKATKAFVDYAGEVARTRAIPIAAAEIVKILVDNGLTVWNAVHEQRKQDHLEEGNRIEKELRWPKWEEIK
jgi:hypothetical protein